MDNRITKKRLNNFLSYEWLVIIAISVVAIIAWEVIFSVFSVKLTVGQQFKCFYDYDIDYSGANKFSTELYDNEVLSPFVMDWATEQFVNDKEHIKAKLGIQDVDVLFTSSKEENGLRRVNSYIDDYLYTVYSYEELLKDAKDYLKTFLEIEGSDETNFENLSASKIEQSFLTRYKKDNNYRTDAQKTEGIKKEKERLKKLCDEVKDFERALQIGKERGIFYTYTRFTQANVIEEGFFDDFIAQEVKDQAFGLDMGKLSGGEDVPQSYAKIEGALDAKNVVLIVFNLSQHQPDLQFESISVINMIIRNCTDIL